MRKDELRRLMKEKRKKFPENYRKELSEKIFAKLSSLDEYKSAKSVCVYMHSFGEVETSLIIQDLRKTGKEILFPISNVKTNTLTLCRDMGKFVSGAYGILEPFEKTEVDFSVPDLIIVPALAFDEQKNRLGFGAGYYDRLLAQRRAVKIGICYDFQVVSQIASEPHDIKMDMIITEERIIV